MLRRIPILVSVVAVAVLAVVSLGLVHSSDRSAFGQTVQVVGTRVSHVAFDRAWRGYCGTDFCGVPTIAQIEITTPTDADTVDVVLGATFDYRITAGDAAFVSAVLGRPGQPGLRPMLPGQLEIRSANAARSDSTTLNWAIGRLAARGARYVLSVAVSPHDASHSGSATVSGQRGLLVAYVST